MSTHLSRKELKQDNVALKVEETAHFMVTHRDLVYKVGALTVAVLVLGLGSWFFITSRRDARELALGNALTLENAVVGSASTNGAPSFPTEAAKTDAIKKAFNSIVSQDGGSEEAYAAEYYLAGIDLADGRMDEALKKYDHVAGSAGSDFGSMAKLGKAEVLFALGHPADAQAVLKDLIANPTAMVSKEQATIALAHGIAGAQPEEARKLLMPLASAKNADVSQAAIAALGDLPQK